MKASTNMIKNQISKVENGDFSQGIILKLEGDNLRIDFNKEGLTNALMDSLRSDFRKYFFQGS
jgi:vacuolar-type H+-ATPase subunit E/Vma4